MVYSKCSTDYINYINVDNFFLNVLGMTLEPQRIEAKVGWREILGYWIIWSRKGLLLSQLIFSKVLQTFLLWI